MPYMLDSVRKTVGGRGETSLFFKGCTENTFAGKSTSETNFFDGYICVF